MKYLIKYILDNNPDIPNPSPVIIGNTTDSDHLSVTYNFILKSPNPQLIQQQQQALGIAFQLIIQPLMQAAQQQRVKRVVQLVPQIMQHILPCYPNYCLLVNR